MSYSPLQTFITPRVQSVVDAATITPNSATDDAVNITAIAQNFTLANPSGTPVNFQRLSIRIKDNGVPRVISYGGAYISLGVTLPIITVATKILTLGFIYDTTSSSWGLVALTTQA